MATATIGIVPVACLAGRAAVVLNATMISGLRLTNSAASSRSRSEQIDSCRNRLVRWLGGKRLVRIFGQQKGLDARAVMDDRDIVCVDLSSLAGEDAAFLSIILTCRYLKDAKRRPPNMAPPHRLIIDEAGSGSLCNATALLLSEAAKFGLRATFSLQHLGQLEEKGELVARAMMVNTGCKIVFNTPDAESARILAEQMYTGHLDLEEWKPRSSRPLAVGNEHVTLYGSSRSEQHASSRSTSKMDSSSLARASAEMSAAMSSSGTGFGSGENTSFSMLPVQGLFEPPPLMGMNRVRSSSSMTSEASGSSRGASSSRQTARSWATTESLEESHSSSESYSESEAYITRYEEMPTQMFSLEEQLHKATGRIMTLDRRMCLVKTESRAPFLARTPDIPAPFKSPEFRAEWWPRYVELTSRRSRYLMPGDKVDVEIAARLEMITQEPVQTDIDFAEPEPAPIIEALERAQQKFKRSPPPSPDREPPPRAKPTFRVFDGGKDGDNA